MTNIGVLGCAEIASRMFLPELLKNKTFKCIGIAEAYDKDKLKLFSDRFKIDIWNDFDEIINDSEVDAVYIPLPPALHYPWAKKALEANKHVFLEKPSTTNFGDTSKLVNLARAKKRVLHENYMFQYHSQLKELQDIIEGGEIGDIQLYKASFGFPLRASNDFRYNKELGGGALLDAAGYVTKLATLLLGDTIIVETASLNNLPGFDVDMYGSVTFSNNKGLIVQGSFSMNAFYQCSLEAWGSKGRLLTNRVFTAPPGFKPVAIIENADGKVERVLNADSHFAHSIEMFSNAINDQQVREEIYEQVLLQANLIQKIREEGE